MVSDGRYVIKQDGSPTAVRAHDLRDIGAIISHFMSNQKFGVHLFF